MNDNKMNNELDNFFRTQLESLPEENPSDADWQQMNRRIHAEGLLGGNSNGRKYFLLVLAGALLSGLVSLPYIIKNKNGKQAVESAGMMIMAGGNDGSNQEVSVESRQVRIKERKERNSENAAENGQPAYMLSGGATVRNSVIDDNTYSNGDRSGIGNDNAESQQGKQMSDLSPLQDGTTGMDGAALNNNNTDVKNDLGDLNSESPDAGASQASQDGVDGKNMIKGEHASGDMASASPDAIPAASNDLTFESQSLNTAQLSCEPEPPRLRIGVYASLDNNFYSLRRNSNVPQAESDFVSQSDLINGEQLSAEYTVGIMGGYMFSKKLTLEAGAFYTQKKKLHANINIPAYSLSTGQEMFTDFRYDYQGRYFEVYGRGKYYFLQKRNALYVTAGVATGFNLPGNDSSDYFSRTSYVSMNPYGETPPVKTDRVSLESSSMSLVLVISAGAEIPVSKRWNIFIEPAYRHSLTPVIKHPSYDQVPVEHYLRSISIATGLMYKF